MFENAVHMGWYEFALKQAPFRLSICLLVDIKLVLLKEISATGKILTDQSLSTEHQKI